VIQAFNIKKKKDHCRLFLPPVLINPLNKLLEIAATREVSVDDLVEALRPTAEEVGLI